MEPAPCPIHRNAFACIPVLCPNQLLYRPADGGSAEAVPFHQLVGSPRLTKKEYGVLPFPEHIDFANLQSGCPHW